MVRAARANYLAPSSRFQETTRRSSAALPRSHRPFRHPCGRPRTSGRLGAGSIGAGCAVACCIAALLLPSKPARQKPKTLFPKESQALTAVWPIGHNTKMLTSFTLRWVAFVWRERQRAPFLFTIVYRCLQVYLFRGVTKMIVFQCVASGVAALVNRHRLLHTPTSRTTSAVALLSQPFCMSCSSASCSGRVYCCNRLFTAVTSCVGYSRKQPIQP